MFDLSQVNLLLFTGLWTGSSEADRTDAIPNVEIRGPFSFFEYTLIAIINVLFKTVYFRQFKALFIKRVIHSLRNKSLVIAQIIVPIASLLVTLVYIKYAPLKPEDSPALQMNLSKYRDNFVPYKMENMDVLSGFENVFKNIIDENENTIAFNLNDNKTVTKCIESRRSINDFIACMGRLSLNYINDNYVIGSEISYDNQNNELSILGNFNDQPYHAPPLTLNLISNVLLNYFGLNDTSRKITVINHPLPRDLAQIIKDLQEKNPTGFQIATNITFGFSFLIASFALFLIKERVSGWFLLCYSCNKQTKNMYDLYVRRKKIINFFMCHIKQILRKF